ncbi:MAG: YhgE/Pip domain-containing protein [Ligilactobacillus agilis]|uniref:YhgE/Pip domain-containing protein n=1 Tax=Ligilactobacillus agilis TaxID=1601 RepID=UPI002430556E|nr:YhgE/Pip domain-containing protein [Ligilactobacillus agilis]MCI5761258.1 YhgE/Pip domain-containing protein [Ligilactobacillus agilis]
MIIEEFKNLKRHKILIATILGIMSLPFLYSLFFLKSVWDPYGSTSYLPVAVVNKDQATYYQGKKFQVGHDLVSKLKDNDDLEWHFVSEKEANDGLSHKKYYMVITIPKNFSKNATTVLNRHPHKMNLTYKTNDSLNYIGKVISETGAKQVNSEIRESVSTAYADTMFKVVKKVGKGFSEAASGSKQLADGSKVLNDGLNTYTAGVGQVNNGVIQLAAGVVPLSDGVQKLTAGSTALATGLKTYTAGVSQVNNGVQTLNSSTGTLATGVNALAAGSNSLKDGIGQYTAGVSQLDDGLGKLAAGSQKLSQLPQGVAATYVLTKTLSTSLDRIPVGQLNTMVEQMQTTNKQTQDLQKLMEDPSLQALQKQLPTIKQNIPTIKTTLDGLQPALTSFQDSLTQNLTGIGRSAMIIGNNSQTAATDSGKIAAEAQALIKSGANLTEDQKNTLNTIVSQANESMSKTSESGQEALKIGENIANVQNAAKTLNGTLTKALPLMKDLSTTVDGLDSATDTLTKIMSQSNALLTSSNQMTGTQAQAQVQSLVKGIAALQSTAAQANKLASTLNTSLANKGVSDAEINKIIQAGQTGVTPAQLQAQLTTMSGEMAKSSNINDLINGLAVANTGTKTLMANNGLLNSGASQLAGGLGTLNANVPALTSGVSQLASGTSQLVANNGQLNSGASQLAGGLGTLNAQIPTMTNGVNQLASGTGQLAANSSALTDGSDKIYKGNKKLAKSMKQGANTIKKVKTGKDNAKMFAAPSNLVEKHYSYVPNYGYALAPYMLSVALFVGAMVFNLVYPIRRLESEDETAFEWFMAKVTIGSIVAIGNALVEALLMIAVGLHPDHLGAMLANGILFSLAMMFLIMFFSVAFQNPGRFLCMILLVIQLGASGGSFPIEITKGLGGFFQAVNPYLPMTYSIYGFRQALTSGLGASQMITSYSVSLLFLVISLGLLYVAMVVVRPNVEYVEEVDINNYTKQN